MNDGLELAYVVYRTVVAVLLITLIIAFVIL
jgi:hypothetical protein